MQFTIKQGMNQDILKSYPDNHFDSIVTDPPYGIEFLGKDWDSNTGAVETWEQCFRVLKPGGYILAFSAARTYHHLATNIESVGFEIRDQLMWIYASGFPKAQDIGKAIQRRQGVKETYTVEEWEAKQGYNVNRPGETMGFGDPEKLDGHKDSGLSGKIAKCTSPEAQQWSGWKTALKPAHEPIVMARKPFKGSAIDNVLKHGTGALNIDASRVEWEPGEQEKEQLWRERYMAKNVGGPTFQETNIKEQKRGGLEADAPQGRFPSNVLGEIPDYQKYFYCPKVSRAERHTGFEQDTIATGNNFGDGLSTGVDIMTKAKGIATGSMGNNHPTVKPVALMSYLVKLVTPPGGKVLDPFNGSGSTGMACVEHGFDYTGCELDPAYVDIATKRINGWYDKTRPDTNFDELFTKGTPNENIV